LLSEDARKRIIENIGENIKLFKALETKWVGDAVERGINPDEAINVMVVRMLIILETNWQNTEKELLVMESDFRKLTLVKEKTVSRKKK
jgi:hypothetical protein